MSVVLGEGTFRYEVAEGWGELPAGWRYGDVGAVGIDRKDNVYVFNRGPHPMIVYDREGRFLRSWGEGIFHRAHGLHMGPDDTIFLTDDGDHTVRQCTLDGKILLTIGIPGRPAPFMSGEPFHRCTHTALSPKGEIYVTDGYGNACVHKFSSDGKLLCPLTTVCGARFGLIQERMPLIAASSSTTTTRPRKNRRAQVENDDSGSVDHGVCPGSSTSRAGPGAACAP